MYCLLEEKTSHGKFSRYILRFTLKYRLRRRRKKHIVKCNNLLDKEKKVFKQNESVMYSGGEEEEKKNVNVHFLRLVLSHAIYILIFPVSHYAEQHFSCMLSGCSLSCFYFFFFFFSRFFF